MRSCHVSKSVELSIHGDFLYYIAGARRRHGLKIQTDMVFYSSGYGLLAISEQRRPDAYKVPSVWLRGLSHDTPTYLL